MEQAKIRAHAQVRTLLEKRRHLLLEVAEKGQILEKAVERKKLARAKARNPHPEQANNELEGAGDEGLSEMRMHVVGKESIEKPSNHMKNPAKTELLSDDTGSDSPDTSRGDYDSDEK